MGDTGPCGPCTEIHYDRVGNRDAAYLVNNDDPTCLEIWNLVFIQFNREIGGSLKPLPAKHVDTGMGFERLTSVLQNKMSNYDTDVFMPIFDDIQKATGARPYSGKIGLEDVDRVDMAYRVVADHIRTLSFAIADGSRPGNDGREYVLRSILRRAVRYGKEILKAEEGFFSGLVSSVIRVMGDVFRELKEHEKKITEIIKEEEAIFCKTLAKGTEKFRKVCQSVQGNTLSGEDAFILQATYGFPIDLTQLMAEEQGLLVDVDGFNKAMKEAKDISKNAQNKQAGGTIVMDADATSTLHKMGVSATNDSFKYICFQGHESEVKGIYTGSAFLESSASGDNVGLVLASTSFYAQQGGQIFDTGIIEGSFETGEVSVGDKVTCKVDYERRKLIAPNHTCTHMLNFALKEVLGDHIDQKGSIVLPEKLRFDFSHGRPVDPEDLRKIESIVNTQIKDELEVYSKESVLSEAKRIKGLRAVFGEVYPDPVRVVAIGRRVEDLLADPENDEWSSLSSEFCGGTHITNTREAKAFALLSEEGIATGVRRIIAVTADCAFDALNTASLLEKEVDDASKSVGSALEKKVNALKRRVDEVDIPAAKRADIKAKIAQLQNEVRKAQKKIAEENLKKSVQVATEAAESAASDGKTFCIVQIDVGLDAAAVREAVSKVMQKKGMSVMVFSTDENSNKAVVCAGVPDKSDQFKQLDVIEWLTTALGPIKGKCGKGKSGLASGQGTDASQVSAALDLAASFASMKLN
ncbi:Alanine--tRNA ligase [Raphanus sativus]|nr:Alanine--tRNA ligase [Raphanus sativus]